MRTLSLILTAILGLAVAACGQTETQGPSGEAASLPTDASWTLDGEASRIAFVSIKDGEFIETHYFPSLSGSVAPSGESTVDIALEQVETKIDIRNDRMREMLFETGQFPTATIRTNVDPSAIEGLGVGERTRQSLTGTLTLHGQDAQIDVDAFVTRISPTRVEVQSVEPVVVYLSDFNLEPGLERLREVAGLSSITASSPVTFTFVFDAAA